MNKYVDGFLIPIPKDKIDEYKKLSRMISEIYKEYGALEYCECVGEDMNIKDVISFNKAADASENQSVMFAFVVFESREHRDKVNAQIHKDPRIIEECKNSPYIDFTKLVYSGFSSFVKF